MAKRARKTITSRKNGQAYLTKRTLVRATKKASARLATDAMKLKGYVIQAEGKWIVRVDKAGNRTRLAQISDFNSTDKVVI